MRLPNRTRAFFAATAATSALLMTAACGGGDDGGTTDTSSSSAPATDTGDSAATSGDYADGSYQGEGSYPNPGGVSSVSVTLTLEGGVVKDLTVEPGASGTSLQYQQKFISGIDAEVVGKSLDEISVSKVSGSSLTSQGFNDALEQIKSEASQS